MNSAEFATRCLLRVNSAVAAWAAVGSDVYGRPSNSPCFNHEDYRGHLSARVEDCLKSYPGPAGIPFARLTSARQSRRLLEQARKYSEMKLADPALESVSDKRV